MSSPFWKQFEEEVFSRLKRLQKKQPLVVHRFYDTHSAGNLLPNQPADFLVINEGHSILLELKASETYDSLRSCFSGMVSSGQVAHHALWRRAGANCWFLFQTPNKRYELWPASEVVRARIGGKRLDVNKCRVEGSLDAAITSILETRNEASLLQRPASR